MHIFFSKFFDLSSKVQKNSILKGIINVNFDQFIVSL